MELIIRDVIQEMKTLGYEVITALVKGDNASSYRLVEKNGLRRCSIRELTSYIGIRGIFKMFWKTGFANTTSGFI